MMQGYDKHKQPTGLFVCLRTLTAAQGVGWMTVDGGDDSRPVTDEGTFFIRMAILTSFRFNILLVMTITRIDYGDFHYNILY